jgi:hypothetical protein
MLWRCPAVYREMPASWVNTDSLLMDLEGRNGDAAILVTGGVHGVALVAGGALVGVYTETERQPVASLERFAALLRAPGARVTLRQNPEERPVDQMPETAYHAFVEAAGEISTPLREPFAARPAPDRGGSEPRSAIPAAESATPPVAASAPFEVPAAEPVAWDAPAEVTPEAWDAPAEVVPEAWDGPAPEAASEVPAWSGAPVEPGGTADAAAPPGPPAPSGYSDAPTAPDLSGGATTPAVPYLAVVPDEAVPPAELAGQAAPTAEPAGAPETAAWPTSPLADFDEVSAPLAPWSGVYRAAPAAGEGASGPAQFADFAASQGMDDLAAPTPGPDFDTVKADLIQIGALWLGTDGVGPIAEMLQRARPTIADVMAAVDAIKNVALPGFEPSVVQAMAREMYYHAAEYLSGL